jgi:hypothetical protein
MERLHGVLAERTDDLAGMLTGLRGYDRQVAKRFVTVAGADLIHSFVWQSSELDTGDLAALSNVTRLLGGMHAGRIARALGIPVTDVWSGLRAFVPEVLSLATEPVRSHGSETAGRGLYVGPSAVRRSVGLGPPS